MLAALHSALSPLGVPLAGIRTEELSKSPADQLIVIQHRNWVYRWRIERVELTLSNFTEDDLKSLPGLLEAHDGWMRQLDLPLEYSTRHASYSGHFILEGSTSQRVLEHLPHLKLGDRIAARAGGQILHWSDTEQGWQGDFLFDHSSAVPDGLFVLLSGTTTAIKTSYGAMIQYLEGRLDDFLGRLDLRLERGSQ